MKTINNVAILGAGAIGGAMASIFHDSSRFSVWLVAQGERFDRLERDGLVVNGKQYTIPVVHAGRATQPADLIVVALKHHQLQPAMNDLEGLVGDDTLIISLMNGLDSEALLGAAYGIEHILYAIIIGIDAVRQGNRINFSIPGKIFVGQAKNREITPPVSRGQNVYDKAGAASEDAFSTREDAHSTREDAHSTREDAHSSWEKVYRVQDAFNRAGIIHETPPDMLRMLWWKLMVNVGVNQASAVMRAPYGVFQTMPDAQWLMESLMRELIELAGRAGIDLKPEDIQDWYAFMNTLSPEGKTSMLQDVEAGRRTETDIFAGKVVELGKKYGVPTPVNETVWRIIHVMEARYE